MELNEETLENLKKDVEAFNKGKGLKICTTPTRIKISDNALYEYLKSYGWRDEEIQNGIEAMIKSRFKD